MGLIDSVSSIKKELSYNEKQAQARYTQAQIKSKYKNDIENTTLAYLDKYYSKYGNFDLLFYNRYEYIQFIIDDIVKNDINRLYNNFDIALDVNKSFLKIFKQFKQVKEYDLEIESNYNLINENENDKLFLKKEHIVINIFIILCVITLIKALIFSTNILGLIVLAGLIWITKIIFKIFRGR